MQLKWNNYILLKTPVATFAMPSIFLACSENNIGMKQALHFQGIKLLFKKATLLTMQLQCKRWNFTLL